MAQSLSRVLIHIVFSTSGREKIITDDIKTRLHSYIAKLLKDKNSLALRIGGTSDHIHIACTLPRTISQSELIKHIKANSSKWLTNCIGCRFAWQKGYGIFSIGESQLPQLSNYIDNQTQHHRKITFKEEFQVLLKKYKISYEEAYVWD